MIGFKLYMGNTFGKIPSPSTGAMLEAFEVVAPTGKRISLHAETNSIMERRETRLRAAGRTDPLAHLASRPAVVAIEAVSRAAILAEWTGARIHILHISSADELRPLREAKARGVDITGETCPHYLMLSADDYARFAGVIRVNPPVREARNQEPLWAALADGTVDLIATDHAPHSREEKTRNDILTVDCGFPGVETQMPLMLTQVNAGRMTIMDYVAMSAAKPAKIFGLYPRKGVIAPGAEADIAVVDLKREMTIDDATLQSRAKITPWHGRKVKGLPIHTLVRGRFVMRDRTLVEGTRGHGRSVHTIQQMPAPAPRNTDQTHDVHHPRAGAANRERRMSEDDFVKLENIAVTYGRKAEHSVTRWTRPICASVRAILSPWSARRLRQVDHPQARRRADPRDRAAMSMLPDANSAPSRCASAWRSRTRPCCRGCASATT